MPLTTSSAKARDLYQRAVLDYELLYLEAGDDRVAGGGQGRSAICGGVCDAGVE